MPRHPLAGRGPLLTSGELADVLREAAALVAHMWQTRLGPLPGVPMLPRDDPAKSVPSA